MGLNPYRAPQGRAKTKAKLRTRGPIEKFYNPRVWIFAVGGARKLHSPRTI